MALDLVDPLALLKGQVKSIMRWENDDTSARALALVLLLLVFLVPACATYPLVLSNSLRPALSDSTIDFAVDHFNATIGRDGSLEVSVRVNRGIDDYRADFASEVRTAAALCAALANVEPTFGVPWPSLELKVINEYGPQLRWKTAHSFTTVTMSREALLDLRKRRAAASEYPEHWRLYAAKVGPPDYHYFEWSPAGAE